MLYLVIFAIGMLVYFAMRSDEVVHSDAGGGKGNDHAPPAPDNDLGRTIGGVIGVGTSIAGLIAGGGAGAGGAAGGGAAVGGSVGGTATTTGTTLPTLGANGAAGGGAATAAANTVSGVVAAPSTGMLVMVGIIALAYIVMRISNSVMAANKLYESRFTNLANPVRCFIEMDAQEQLLLRSLANHYKLTFSETEVRDTSLDWASYIGDDATGNEMLSRHGYRPTFTINTPPPPVTVMTFGGGGGAPLPQYNGNDATAANIAAFNKEAAIICVANREMWYEFTKLALAIKVAVVSRNSKVFDADVPFKLNEQATQEVARPLYEHFYNRPMVWTGYKGAPALPSATYEPARARGRMQAMVQVFRLAKFDPVIWLASDAHLYPSYFLNSIGFPNGDSFYFRRQNGWGQANQPKWSRTVILKGESIGIDRDVSFDLWDIRTGVGGIELV